MDVRMILVHKNVDLDAFQRAACRQDVAIFYDPIGGLPIGDISEEEFDRRALWVHPESVMLLAKLLQSNASVDQILARISPYRRRRDDVLMDFEPKIERVKRSPSTIQHRLYHVPDPLVRADGIIVDTEGTWPTVRESSPSDTRLQVRRPSLVHKGISGCGPDNDDD